jgi:hypothetical protein
MSCTIYTKWAHNGYSILLCSSTKTSLTYGTIQILGLFILAGDLQPTTTVSVLKILSHLNIYRLMYSQVPYQREAPDKQIEDMTCCLTKAIVIYRMCWNEHETIVEWWLTGEKEGTYRTYVLVPFRPTKADPEACLWELLSGRVNLHCGLYRNYFDIIWFPT